MSTSRLLALSFITCVASSLTLQAFAMTDIELAAAMKKDFSKNLVTVKSPKLFFHWVDASDVTPSGQYNSQFPSDSPNFKAYVQKEGRKVYNKLSPNNRDIAGPGLYLAYDSIVSRHYGGKTSFGLIVGQLKVGARILPNLLGGLKVSQTIYDELSYRGCDGMTDYLFLIDSSKTECLKIKQLLVGKDVSFADGRFYAWGERNRIGCSNYNPSIDIGTSTRVSSDTLKGFTAMVAYNTNLFSKIVGLTHKSKKGSDPFGNKMLSYLKGMHLSQFGGLLSKEQMADDSIKPMSESELIKFNQENLIGCVK